MAPQNTKWTLATMSHQISALTPSNNEQLQQSCHFKVVPNEATKKTLLSWPVGAQLGLVLIRCESTKNRHLPF